MARALSRRGVAHGTTMTLPQGQPGRLAEPRVFIALAAVMPLAVIVDGH